MKKLRWNGEITRLAVVTGRATIKMMDEVRMVPWAQNTMLWGVKWMKC